MTYEELWKILRDISFRDYCDVPYEEIENRPRYIFIKEKLKILDRELQAGYER